MNVRREKIIFRTQKYLRITILLQGGGSYAYGVHMFVGGLLGRAHHLKKKKNTKTNHNSFVE